MWAAYYFLSPGTRRVQKRTKMHVLSTGEYSRRAKTVLNVRPQYQRELLGTRSAKKVLSLYPYGK